METLRLGFATLYAGLSVVIPLLVIPQATLPIALRAGAMVGLVAITLIQFLISLKLSKAVEHNTEHINLLVALAPDAESGAAVALWRPMMGMIIRGSWRKMRVNSIVSLLYGLVLIAWVGVLALQLVGLA